MSDLECSNCGEPIEEDEEYETLEDGSLLCSSCFDELYAQCVMCGKAVLRDDLKPWGDDLICPDCLEKECPSFDPKENEKETAAAYEAMKRKYIGRKVAKCKDAPSELEYDSSDPCVRYSLSVELDDEGRICDISRLTAELLLSEWENGSDWEPYRIDSDDYGWLVDSMFDEEYEFEDDV